MATPYTGHHGSITNSPLLGRTPGRTGRCPTAEGAQTHQKQQPRRGCWCWRQNTLPTTAPQTLRAVEHSSRQWWRVSSMLGEWKGGADGSGRTERPAKRPTATRKQGMAGDALEDPRSSVSFICETSNSRHVGFCGTKYACDKKGESVSARVSVCVSACVCVLCGC